MNNNDDFNGKYRPPPAAIRPQIAYDSATDSMPREIEYGSYKKLGLISNKGQTAQSALFEARRRWGKKALVFLTARFYVAYLVE